MAQKVMYPGMINSPETAITNNINESDTIIYVLDPARVPTPPNLMTLGTGTNAETVKVTEINDSAITVERGFQGIAKSWPAGAVIARNFTEYDYDTLKENIEDLDASKETPAGAQFKADAAESAAADYTDQEVGDLAGSGRTTETVKGNADALDSHLSDYASKFPDNAGAHNSIYRGKDLGTSVTTEQYTNIANGTFKDLYIGDYWTINGTKYLIAAFNYYYNTGDTALTDNHVVIVPYQSLYSHVMNETNTTDGGYTGSKLYTEGLDAAKSTITTDFSGHVVTFRAYFCNAVTNGEASAGGWVDSTVDLMNEIMVYGSIVNGRSTYGFYNIGTEKVQLPLFALNPQSVNTRYSYWLRDVASASRFAYVGNSGYASRGDAAASVAVRPRFLIS